MRYEIRKWAIKPVLKEVIGRAETEEEVKDFLKNHHLTLNDDVEVEDMKTSRFLKGMRL